MQKGLCQGHGLANRIVMELCVLEVKEKRGKRRKVWNGIEKSVDKIHFYLSHCSKFSSKNEK
jgi:hypothetical protein